MVRIGLIVLAARAVLAAVGLAPASATTMFPQQFTCPMGGDVFEDYVIGSYSSFGQRPDGRAYGTLPVLPLVECPGNGFLLFEDAFTPEEIALLTPLVGSAEYQAMRQGETPHHRAWWLMRALGREPEQLASALLVASWESDDDLARRVWYQRAFLEATAGIAPDSDGWLLYQLRAANALRELGQFGDASALLARIGASNAWPEDEDEREGARYLLEGLRPLVADRNPHPELTNLIPTMIAAERCMGETSALSPAERVACAEPDNVEAIAHRRAFASQKAEFESTALEAQAATAMDAAMADAEAGVEAAAEAAAKRPWLPAGRALRSRVAIVTRGCLTPRRPRLRQEQRHRTPFVRHAQPVERVRELRKLVRRLSQAAAPQHHAAGYRRVAG